MKYRDLTVLGALIVALVGACGAKTQLPFCGAPPLPACFPSDRHASKTTCVCAASVTTFNNCMGTTRNFAGSIPVCLPPNINSGLIGTLGKTQTDIDKDPNYDLELKARCDQVDDALRRIASLFFPPAIACGSGIPCVATFSHSCAVKQVPVGQTTQPFVTENTTCDTTCVSTPCVRGTTCNNPLNMMTGVINPDACFCTTITGCSGTVGPICRPPIGSPDPPPNESGILTGLLAEQSTLTIEPSSSPFHFVITEKAEGGNVVTKQSTPIHGEVLAFGVPRQDGSADVLLDMRLTMDEMHFKTANQNVDLTYILATGGAGTSTIAIDKFGDGTINMGQFSIVLDFTQNGQRSRLETTNSKDVSIHVDYPGKMFHIPSIPFDTGQGLTGDFELTGKISNQGPVARTKQGPPLECTSPAGASAKLDGSASSDADNDIRFSSWTKGEDFSGDILSNDLVTSVVSPLGTTSYTLQLMDSEFQMSFSTTRVTVKDETAPVLVLASPQPECLWAPNHKVVLYDLGKNVPFTVKDTCDPNPKVEIGKITSNQPDLGGGQGDFTPDFASGAKSFCLRSERQGTVMWDREYTIPVIATDASGNTTKKTVVVRVPHDQSGAAKCPLVDPSRFVDITDPRCTQK